MATARVTIDVENLPELAELRRLAEIGAAAVACHLAEHGAPRVGTPEQAELRSSLKVLVRAFVSDTESCARCMARVVG